MDVPIRTRANCTRARRRSRINQAVGDRAAQSGHAVDVASNGLKRTRRSPSAYDPCHGRQMPEMNYFEAERIREGERASGAHVPIIATPPTR